ncbi:hypothetical protein Lepto7375DRAFT_0956 [Leptolyngbya sp. PCC 7375]|nr:hypothetical protein Lepto7375DRAFT_0956 [Leptolyngbya sp. PCC 7375]
MNQSDIAHRDQVLRAYFEGRNWDQAGEQALKQRFVSDSKTLLPDYPFVINDEWEVNPGRTDEGRGDLVFTDGNGRFAVVEVKYIDLTGEKRSGLWKNIKNSNTKKRAKVRKQAKKYAEYLSEKLDVTASVEAYFFTNQCKLPQRVDLSDVDES